MHKTKSLGKITVNNKSASLWIPGDQELIMFHFNSLHSGSSAHLHNISTHHEVHRMAQSLVKKKAKVWSGTQCSLFKLADEFNQVFYWIDIQNVLCWCTSRIRVRKHSFLDKCWSWVDLCSLTDQILHLCRCCFLWEHRGTLSWGQTETSQADLWGDDELPARYS